MRKQAIDQLGKWFTTVVRTNENQPLIDSGWYGRMRHPSYTGLLMYFLALSLSLNNWLGIVGIICPITCAFLHRVRIEENALHEHSGVKYEEYRKKCPTSSSQNYANHIAFTEYSK